MGVDPQLGLFQYFLELFSAPPVHVDRCLLTCNTQSEVVVKQCPAQYVIGKSSINQSGESLCIQKAAARFRCDDHDNVLQCLGPLRFGFWELTSSVTRGGFG